MVVQTVRVVVFSLLFSASVTSLTASTVQTGVASSTWEQFVAAKQNQTEPALPDFSYAGYHYFSKPVPDVTHPVFDVTDYGAIANDDQSDQSAIRRAIAAAEANGSGIVFFPPGEFLVNTDTDPNQPIYIRGSHIVLRGSGSRTGGTIIRQVNNLPPANPNQLYSTPFMFRFKPDSAGNRLSTSVTDSAARETFWITVADASELSVGQWITLHMNITEAIDEFLSPRSPNPSDSSWEVLFEKGIIIRERHSIAEIQGNRIRLNEPLHTKVNHDYGWEVRFYKFAQHLEEVGVEDISFHGSFWEEFVHHKNARHDGGYSLLRLEQCVNSWVRRISLINVNWALTVIDSAAVSVYQVTVAGNGGHHSIKSEGNYGTWVGLSEDLANHLHGIGPSHRAAGTVFYRFDMSPGQAVDIHRTKPSYATLYDRVNNGRLDSSGGGRSTPHHLRHLVFWNFNHGGMNKSYNFWRNYLRFLFPIIVGFHGNPASFDTTTLDILESDGVMVTPESLFEAQLALRLGAVPSWLSDLRTGW